jgi:hypothetical protein
MKLNSVAKTVGLAGLSAFIGAAAAISFLKIDSLTAPPDPAQPSRIAAHYLADPFAGVGIEDLERESAMVDLNEREDDKYVYLDLKVEDPKATSLKTSVEDGYLSITGEIEKNQGDDVYYKSSFSRTFPLPSGVDAAKMQMEPDGDKIVFKFPKVKV